MKDILCVEEPEDIEDFIMLLQACISTPDSEGADLFDFYIMTPKGLLRFIDVDEMLPMRAIFVVDKPNIEANIESVKQRINKILERCIRETWEEVALAINYYLDWKYYDPRCGICDFYLTTRGFK